MKERLTDSLTFNGEDASKTIEAFLHPLKPSEFFSAYYEKRHVKISRATDKKMQNKCQQLFNKGEVPVRN